MEKKINVQGSIYQRSKENKINSNFVPFLEYVPSAQQLRLVSHQALTPNHRTQNSFQICLHQYQPFEAFDKVLVGYV